jgi:hypothetical protein
VFGTGSENFFDIDLIPGPPQHLPAGDVAENGRVGIGDGADDPPRLLLAAILRRLCTLATTKSKRSSTASG